MTIWYIFPVLVSRTNKNLATLLTRKKMIIFFALVSYLHLEHSGRRNVGLFIIFSVSFFFKSCHPIPRRDSISRPIAPASSVAGGDDAIRPRRQGKNYEHK
jgi:hypothetical protein